MDSLEACTQHLTGKDEPMKTIDMFATPNSMAELELWIAQARDPMVTTAAMMMYNLLVSKYDMKEKEDQ